MDVVEAIRTRRSIRSFAAGSVPVDVLRQILCCGLFAPSSKNSNPWFFVIADQGLRQVITDTMRKAAAHDRIPIHATTGGASTRVFDSTESSIETIRECQCLILVFNRGPLSGGAREVLRNPRQGRSLFTYASELIGIGAAVQNILLAAHAHGYGAVYMADSFPARSAVAQALNTDCEMLGSIALGPPGYCPGPRPVHQNLIADSDGVRCAGIPTDNFTATEY